MPPIPVYASHIQPYQPYSTVPTSLYYSNAAAIYTPMASAQQGYSVHLKSSTYTPMANAQQGYPVRPTPTHFPAQIQSLS